MADGEDLMRVFTTKNDDGSEPMSFAFWPSSLYQDNIVKIIEEDGGNVVGYKNRTEHTITFINFPMIADWKDQKKFWEKKLPTDGFLMTFIEDFKKDPDPENVKLSEYSMTPTAYEEYDPSEIMFKEKKWSDQTPLRKSSVERITVKDIILEIVEEFDAMFEDSAARESYKDGENVDSEEELEESESETDDEQNELDTASDDSGDTVIVPSKSDKQQTPVGTPVKESSNKSKSAQGQPLEFFVETFRPPLDKKVKANKSRKPASNQNLDESDEETARSKSRPRSSRPSSRSRLHDVNDVDNISHIELSQSSLSDDDDEVSYVSGPSPSRSRASSSSNKGRGGGCKFGMKRRLYSVSDGQKLLDLIMANRWWSYVKGIDLWKFIADNHLIEYKIGEHSFSSLKNHFLRKMEPILLEQEGGRLKTYTVNAEDWKTYKTDKAHIKPHTNVFHPPSVKQVKGVDHQQLKEFVKKLSERKSKQ